jgi:hypothetical protein
VPWAQRLGYLLTLVGASDRAESLIDYVGRYARETVPLDPASEDPSPTRDPIWKLLVNTEVSPEL